MAAAERKVGAGRVIVWASALDDSYSDLPRKPVYLPLVHQLVKYLAQFESPRSWLTVGQVVDVQSLTKSRANWVVITPSGKRVTSAGPLELDEQGVYEVRPAGGADGFAPQAIAVNIDPAEEDLTPIDPAELVAAVTGHAAPAASGPPDRGRSRAVRRQRSREASRPCGGISCSPACCSWRSKPWCRIGCRRRRRSEIPVSFLSVRLERLL